MEHGQRVVDEDIDLFCTPKILIIQILFLCFLFQICSAISRLIHVLNWICFMFFVNSVLQTKIHGVNRAM